VLRLDSSVHISTKPKNNQELNLWCVTMIDQPHDGMKLKNMKSKEAINITNLVEHGLSNWHMKLTNERGE